MVRFKKRLMRPAAFILTFCMTVGPCAGGLGQGNGIVVYAQTRDGAREQEEKEAGEVIEEAGKGQEGSVRPDDGNDGTTLDGETEQPEPPQEKPGEAGAEEPGEAGAGEPGEAGAEEPGEAGAEEPGEAGAEKPGEAGAEEPGEAGAEEPGEAGAEKPGEAGAEEPGEVGAEEPGESEPDEPGEAEPEEPGEAETGDLQPDEPEYPEDGEASKLGGGGTADPTDTAKDQEENDTWVIVRFEALPPSESELEFDVKPDMEEIKLPSTLAAEVRAENDEDQLKNVDIPVEWLCDGYETENEEEYIFSAEWDVARYTAFEDEAPEITVRINGSAAQSLTGWADGIEVEIRAVDGNAGIPSGAELRVTPVTAEYELEAIREAVNTERKAASGKSIQSVIPLDIEILFEGEVIQPQGEIQVIFRNVPDGNASRSEVFYVSDDRTEAQDMKAERIQTDVTFDVNHFSTYAIVQYAAVERNPQAQVGEGEVYESIKDVLDNLGNDTGTLTVILTGDTSDTGVVVFPRDKGIEKIIITGNDDYLIGEKDVKICANGIPMVFEAGTVNSVVGGGYNSGVENTDLTVKGGKYRYCIGGNLVDQNGVEAEIPGAVHLVFDHMDCGIDTLNTDIYNQIYSGSCLDGQKHDVQAGIGQVELEILDSHLVFDMIFGGSCLGYTGSTYEAPIGEITATIKNSWFVMGDGFFGGHSIGGGNTDGIQSATCGDIKIEITDSDIYGDVFGGSYVTSNAEASLRDISIEIKDSRIAALYAVGAYMGHFKFGARDIQVLLDNSQVGIREDAFVSTAYWYGENISPPKQGLETHVRSIHYTFLNNVSGVENADGEQNIYFYADGCSSGGANVTIGTTQLTLSANTEFIVTESNLDVLEMVPPQGRYFTAAKIDNVDQQLDQAGKLRLENLAEDSVVTAELGELDVKDQPQLVIEGTNNGKIEKVLGEPDFSLNITGGAPGLEPEYHSSDPSVAEVTADGIIHLKKAGTATITVSKESIEYRKTSASVTINVVPAPAVLIPDELPEDHTYVLVAKPVPEEEASVVHEALAACEQIAETANVITMDIKLVDRNSGEHVDGMGATFTIAYPSEEVQQNRADYDFYVLHIPAPGEEYLVPLSLTDTGIRITVNGFSPFVLAYEKREAAIKEDPACHEESGGDGAVSGRWISDAKGWWYQYPGGTWPSKQWAYLECGGAYAWYYFDENGYMADGWLNLGGSWYFLHNRPDGTRGHMYTGWHEINGRQYYFETQPGADCGKLYVNRMTPDGYWVGEDGAWVKQTPE